MRAEVALFTKTLTLTASLSLCFAACSTPPGGSDGTGGAPVGTGGVVASGGAGPATGGASSTGGVPGSGGIPSSGGATGTGGTSSGGAGPGTGGGSSTGGSGTGGGNVGPGIADIPAPPGPTDVPQPSGTPGDISVVDWAGFPAAVTYSFDDNDGSQLDRYAEMHAIGGRYTYYLVSSNFGVAITDPRWQAIFDDGNEIGNHTTNHSCGTSQIDGAATALGGQFGKTPSTLAAPNGDDACQSQAVGRVFINREVGPATPVLPLDSSNPMGINTFRLLAKRQTPTTATSTRRSARVAGSSTSFTASIPERATRSSPSAGTA
jgi:hypothetical protein